MDQNILERKAALLAAQGWEPMRLARTPVGTCVITSDPFVVMDQIMIRVEKTDGKKPESFMFRALRVWPFAVSIATIHVEINTKAEKDSPLRYVRVPRSTVAGKLLPRLRSHRVRM